MKLKQFKTEPGLKLMPTAPGTCEQCGVAHDPEQPHNAQSLAYQYWFYADTGRWPNWKDAMKHCSKAVKAHWTKELEIKGVDVKGGGVNPVRSAPRGE